MKNIYVLLTDKPSRLYYNNNDKTLQFCKSSKESTPLKENRNMCITNDEKPKEGDWSLYQNKIHKCIEDIVGDEFKKIILTTDQDLIKDGVQAIPDEFLEWFVKNPSCEKVEVNKMRYGYLSGFAHAGYKIIIPKEEPKLSNICIKCGVDLYALEGKFVCLKHPKECKGIYLSKETLLIHAAEQKQKQEILEEKLAKIVSKEPSKFLAESDERARIREEKKQHLIDMMKSDEELGLYDEPKQETLEEASEIKFQNTGDRLIFEDGRWQQERSYSEEEVEFIKTLIDFYWSNYNNEHPNNLKDFELSKSILETFKNK